MFSVITFTVYFSTDPSVKSISYSLVSKNGLACAHPTASLSSTRGRLVTRPRRSFADPTSNISSAFKYLYTASS